jgi:hypothetical protein
MGNKTKSQIQNMSDSALLRAYHWNVVNQVKEENFKRGLTKGTEKEARYLKEEMIKRFNLREDFEEIEWNEN